ncbi:MAG TPA: glycerol kinase, partial [Clostridia bacterium]|nr:glycerol kinase [Clostridia bacterium]
MSNKYILGIDQSTQGTKGLLFDSKGNLIMSSHMAHEQIIDSRGFVEHDPIEIINNTVEIVKSVVEQAGVNKNDILGIGISNQRETVVVWDKQTGEPLQNAIVWQCSRGEEICKRIEAAGHNSLIKDRTGLNLSPYFSAAKISWIIKNVKGAREKSEREEVCCGTIDSWLIFNLTNGKEFKTDYSNASRTQLFDIEELIWNKEICELFGINIKTLPEVCDSNSCFGQTDFNGYFDNPIPIHGVLGDSNGALLAQGCFTKGMAKSTYGTGSSVMMNIGAKPISSKNGLVTSLAWGIDGQVAYALEGNVNNSGAVITWIEKDLKLIKSPNESESLAKKANPLDRTYLVPAFTGLGAPYWDSNATGIITGITRTTGQAEVVKAALDSIAYQITDIIKIMSEDSNINIEELRVDGGATKNSYLMQFQSDMLGIPIQMANIEEISGTGVAYLAGIALDFYEKDIIFSNIRRTKYEKKMTNEEQTKLYKGWK